MKLQRKHISTEWDEGDPNDGGDGYWIALKLGWKSDDDPVGALHNIHEDTKENAYKVGVLRCYCSDCYVKP